MPNEPATALGRSPINNLKPSLQIKEATIWSPLFLYGVSVTTHPAARLVTAQTGGKIAFSLCSAGYACQLK